jgi:iron complex transport system substrate-binding protein
MAAAPARIISLAPGVTEMIYALGLDSRLVGVTEFCDYPAGARQKPKIGGMANPSLEAVVSARPDIVVMTTNGNPQEIEQRLVSMGIETYVLREGRVHELPGAIRRMGAALGAGERAEALALRMERALEAYGSGAPVKGKALFIVWPEPLLVGGPGTVIDDAMTMLGYENIASDARAEYPKYSLEEVLRRRPDFIFIGSGHQDNMVGLSRKLLKRLGSTPAVRDGNVFFVGDGLLRFGPRIIVGIEEISVGGNR